MLTNPFLYAAKKCIYPNGVQVTFISVTTGVYNSDTSTVTNTEVSTNLIAFPKNIKATAYNFPNLIGKEMKEYLIVATDLSTAPKPNDKIVQNAITYTAVAIKEHVAQGEIVLYKVSAVKG